MEAEIVRMLKIDFASATAELSSRVIFMLLSKEFDSFTSCAAALACSHHALSLVLTPQIGSEGKPTSYQQMAGYHAERARAVLRGWIARLDDSDEGDGSSYRMMAP